MPVANAVPLPHRFPRECIREPSAGIPVPAIFHDEFMPPSQVHVMRPTRHRWPCRADPESRDVIHPLAAVPHRHKRKEAGAHGPRLNELPNLISAYQKLSLIAVPNIVPLPSVLPVESSFMPAAPSSPGFGSLAPTVREPCVVVLSAVMA